MTPWNEGEVIQRIADGDAADEQEAARVEW
jgi:hypothetical protein